MENCSKKTNSVLTITPPFWNIEKRKNYVKKTLNNKETKFKNKNYIHISKGNIYLQLQLKNRHSRILYKYNPLLIRGIKNHNATSLEKKEIFSSHHEEKDTTSKKLSKKINEMENTFIKDYLSKKNIGNHETFKKNENLFKCSNLKKCEDVTDEELNEKINNLKGPVDPKTMYLVWNFVYDHEKKKYIRMQGDTLKYCKSLASDYKIPINYEKKTWKNINIKMTEAFLKKGHSDFKNIKTFAGEDLCARWEFQRYIYMKRKLWTEYREKIKEKCINKLNNTFKKYNEKK
ncbi:hypothetical protein MKS88_003442 [Plasmodium brasilianum]|uniref:Uncharacterized protein n=1 Tax=Plasmodium brasilianum TaxID=5824 RepID=A0ACB9Y9Y3_PLABR|nr:hypothetical protein MKS88_003442 [Plasmodium brasilianum]